jgi:hypothetical protein
MYRTMETTDSRGIASHGESARLGIFMQAIARVEETLQVEAAVISEYRNDDLPMVNERKTRALFDLDRAIKGLPHDEVSDEAWIRVRKLRDQLEESRRLLLIHLNAAREISALIEKVMAESDSDGTYNFSSFKRP